MELTDIKGVGPKTISLLNKLGIYSVNDLREYYPFRYDVIKRTDLNGDKVIIDGVIETIPQLSFFNKKMNRMSFSFNTGSLLCKVVIFNRLFLKSKLVPGTKIIVIGKYDDKNNTIVASDIRFGYLSDIPKYEPIYHTVNGISSRQINQYILSCLEEDFSVSNYIPS